MDWNIQLNTSGLNNWISHMEQKLTAAKDLLDVLETEEEQLKNIWDSAAKEQWESRLKLLINQAKVSIEEMQKLLLLVNEAASILAQMEKGMVYAAEGM